MKRRAFKSNGKRWCEVTVELQDTGKGTRLSICGSEGSVVSEAKGRKMALDYWESFFEDSPSERHAMNDRFDKNFRTARGAAKFVVATDGEFHGLDVHRQEGGKLYLTESCGQIREDITRWFPEVEPYFKWHLNDMHGECKHQEARGENYTTHPGAVCGECGHNLGSAWLRRKLPPKVVAWAKSFGDEP